MVKTRYQSSDCCNNPDKPYVPVLSANCAAVVNVFEIDWNLTAFLLHARDIPFVAAEPQMAPYLDYQMIDLLRMPLGGDIYSWFKSTDMKDRAGFTHLLLANFPKWDCELCGTHAELKAKWDEVYKENNLFIPFATLQSQFSIFVPDSMTSHGVEIAPSSNVVMTNMKGGKETLKANFGFYSVVANSGKITMFVPSTANDEIDKLILDFPTLTEGKMHGTVVRTGDVGHPLVC